MEARVAVLEQIAKQNGEALAAIRIELSEVRKEVQSGFESARDRHDRDFRITFGATIAVALSLATLVARGFKWL